MGKNTKNKSKSQSNGMIRAFFAVEIPDETILDKIVGYQAKLRKVFGPLKIVGKNLMHITIRFLGNITPEQAEKLYHFMKTEINEQYLVNRKEPLTVSLKGVGDFGKRVFFIKIDSGSEGLEDIFWTLEDYIGTLNGIEKEKRGFVPHLTIARSKLRNPERQISDETRRQYELLLKDYEEEPFGTFEVKEIVLKKSVLTPKGPIYSNLTY